MIVVAAFFPFILMANFGFVAAISWPNPESLILDVPFNNISLLEDRFCNLKPFITGQPVLFTETTGPYGRNGSSYSVSKNGTFLTGYRDLPLKNGLTVCFYFLQAEGGHSSGILNVKFASHNGTYVTIWVDDRATLHVRSFYKGANISRSSFRTQFNGWTYACVAFSQTTAFFSAYQSSSHGATNSRRSLDSPLPLNSSVEVVVGKAAATNDDEVGDVFMSPGDAFACLAVYDKQVISKMHQIREACQIRPPAPTGNVCSRHASSTSTTKPRLHLLIVAAIFSLLLFLF